MLQVPAEVVARQQRTELGLLVGRNELGQRLTDFMKVGVTLEALAVRTLRVGPHERDDLGEIANGRSRGILAAWHQCVLDVGLNEGLDLRIGQWWSGCSTITRVINDHQGAQRSARPWPRASLNACSW